jgi:hypothetical protein
MAIINLTPHSFQVYNESQFVGLEQTNPTTLIADSVEGTALLNLPSSGSIRIATSTVKGEPIDGIPTVKTQYGEAVGIPNNVTNDDTLVVSLRTQSIAKAANHKLASQMASPYKVVRLRSNPSTVLGCMGLSFQ